MEDLDDFIDFYQLMGLTPSATIKDVKKAYKRLALEKHPDRNRDDPLADDKFAIIVEAKDVLADEKRRREYDVTYRRHKQLEAARAAHDARMRQLNAERYAGQQELRARERAAAFPEQSEEYLAAAAKRRKKKRIQEELAQLRRHQRQTQREQKKAAETVVFLERCAISVSWRKTVQQYTERELKLAFGTCGSIEVVKIRDPPNENSAIIAFSTVEAARLACHNPEFVEDWGFSISFLGDKTEAKRIQVAQDWARRRPPDLSHEEFEARVEKKVRLWEQFRSEHEHIQQVVASDSNYIVDMDVDDNSE